MSDFYKDIEDLYTEYFASGKKYEEARRLAHRDVMIQHIKEFKRTKDINILIPIIENLICEVTHENV